MGAEGTEWKLPRRNAMKTGTIGMGTKRSRGLLVTFGILIAVLVCFTVPGIEVDGSDDDIDTASASPDPEAEDQTKFIGTVVVDGVEYKSFEQAVIAANMPDSSKKITFVTDSTFVSKNPWSSQDCWYYNVQNLEIDLGGKTITVGYMGLVLEGNDFKLCNGNLETESSYALFIGNGTRDTENVSIEGLVLDGGVNCFYAEGVHLKGLTFSGHDYYAVWCDGYADVSIEGGSYRTNGYAVIGGWDQTCSMQVRGGIFEVPEGQPLVYVGEDSMAPVITGGFYYGAGANPTEISAYVPDGYHVVEATYNGIEGFEVVSDGTLVTVKIDVQGSGSVDSMGLKVLEGTEVSVEGNVLTVGDRTITATASSDYTFAGWLGVPSGTVTSDVTITALFMKTDSDDEVEVDTDSAKIVVEKTQGTTSIVSEIKTDEVEDVDAAISETLDKIAEVQKVSGSSSGDVAVQVVVPISGETGTLELSDATVAKLKEFGAELTVSNNGTTVSLENKVLESLEKSTTSADPLSIVVTPKTTDLTNAQKTVVGQNQAVDVSAFVGKTKVSDLGGTATISVPYQTDNKVKVTYVKDDGTTENVDCTYVDGVVSFTTTHFSVYMISEVKSPTFIVIPDTSQDDFPVIIPTEKTDGVSDDSTKVAILVGAIVVVIVAIVALARRLG